MHPMKIGGGGVKLFNFDVTFYKAAIALNIIFLFNRSLTSINQENYIIPGFWCKNSVFIRKLSTLTDKIRMWDIHILKREGAELSYSEKEVTGCAIFTSEYSEANMLMLILL